MTLERNYHLEGFTTWTLTITDADHATVKMKPGDKLLLNDCAGDDATIADTLLALELLTRRIEETNAAQ